MIEVSKEMINGITNRILIKRSKFFAANLAIHWQFTL